jgi:hypothetical protein
VKKNRRVRQVHRWLSIAFTVAVIANIVALVKQEEAAWLGLLAFLPMIPLMLTGLYCSYCRTPTGGVLRVEAPPPLPNESPLEHLNVCLHQLYWKSRPQA